MRYYSFRQNNSGGSFQFDGKAGISVIVIIQAHDAPHANLRAEQIGLYFDGCDNDRDCGCCGDRWGRVGESDGKEFPHLWGDSISEAKIWTKWMGEAPEGFVHPLDGPFYPVLPGITP